MLGTGRRAHPVDRGYQTASERLGKGDTGLGRCRIPLAAKSRPAFVASTRFRGDDVSRGLADETGETHSRSGSGERKRCATTRSQVTALNSRRPGHLTRTEKLLEAARLAGFSFQ